MQRVLLSLALCALILPQAGWAITPKEFDDKAIPLMGKPREADRLLRICVDALREVRNDPEFNAFIHVMKSHAHLMKKEYDKAAHEARIVIDSGRQEDLGHSALRDVLFARELFDEGLKICLQGVSRVKGDRNQAAARQDCHDLYLQVTSVTPETLWNAYKKNPSAADAAYKGHPITVLGTVSTVESLAEGRARVTFALDKSGSRNVICLFGSVPEETAPTEKPAADKETPDNGADRKQAGDIAYSLGGDDPDASDGQPKETPPAAPADRPAGNAAPELPVIGTIVVISGSVRGMEANNVVLINCEKIR